MERGKEKEEEKDRERVERNKKINLLKLFLNFPTLNYHQRKFQLEFEIPIPLISKPIPILQKFSIAAA